MPHATRWFCLRGNGVGIGLVRVAFRGGLKRPRSEGGWSDPSREGGLLAEDDPPGGHWSNCQITRTPKPDDRC